MQSVISRLDDIAQDISEDDTRLADMISSEQTQRALLSMLDYGVDLLSVYGVIDEVYTLFYSLDEPDRSVLIESMINNLSEYTNPADAYYDLSNEVSTQQARSVVDSNKQNNTYYESEKSSYEQPELVDESVGKCPNCKSKKVKSFSKQLRSADEPETTIFMCTMCKAEFRHSA